MKRPTTTILPFPTRSLPPPSEDPRWRELEPLLYELAQLDPSRFAFKVSQAMARLFQDVLIPDLVQQDIRICVEMLVKARRAHYEHTEAEAQTGGRRGHIGRALYDPSVDELDRVLVETRREVEDLRRGWRPADGAR
jgi:hypothetical protein